MRARRTTSWGHWRRRTCAGLVLAAYLVTCLGLPFPVAPARPGDPAPTGRHRACGCATADQCRRCCCCSGGGEAADRGQTPAGSMRWVSGPQTLRCHGLSYLWVTAGTVLPAAPAVAWRPVPAPGERLTHPDGAAVACPLSPPEPPPRGPHA